MGVALITTKRPCMDQWCGHGASAHKWRLYKGVSYRAECEHCDCARYIDPMVTLAEADKNIVSDSIKRSGVEVPYPFPDPPQPDVYQRRALTCDRSRENAVKENDYQMSDDAVRAAAEEVYEYPNVHSMRPSVSEIEAIISRHVQTAAVSEQEQTLDEVGKVGQLMNAADASGYRRGVTDAIEEVKRLRERWACTTEGPMLDYVRAADKIITALPALQAKAGGSESGVKVHNCRWKGVVRPYPAALCSMCTDQGESDASLEELCRWYSDLAAPTPAVVEAPVGREENSE